MAKENMMYLAESTNTRDVSGFVAAEFQRVDELRAAGTISAGWLKADFSGAVLVLECEDEGEALAALRTLPTVINNATTVHLTQVVDLDSVRQSLD
jgi:DNA topoisomerase VI subunit B